jgi:PTH1 family peptidyl-tRNA hydrolase
MILIVGLGNPGKKYQNTRHNIGWMVVGKLAQKDENFSEVKFLIPEGYMNLVGKEVKEKAFYFKIPPENIWVVTDDLDLPWGSVRVRLAGSSGGHKGLESVINYLGTDQFPRIRLGIGRPPEKLPAEKYVLAQFSLQEKKFLKVILDKVIALLLQSLKSGLKEQTINIKE